MWYHSLWLWRWLPHLRESKGWRSGESARLPSMWPRFKSWRRHHMWVEFVVGSLLCSERFFSGFSGVLLSSKTNISKFQFDQESGRWRTILWMCYLQIIIYLFIYFTTQVVAMSVTVDNSPIQTTFTRKIILNLLMKINHSWVHTVHGITKFVWHMYIVSFPNNLLIYNNNYNNNYLSFAKPQTKRSCT